MTKSELIIWVGSFENCSSGRENYVYNYGVTGHCMCGFSGEDLLVSDVFVGFEALVDGEVDGLTVIHISNVRAFLQEIRNFSEGRIDDCDWSRGYNFKVNMSGNFWKVVQERGGYGDDNRCLVCHEVVEEGGDFVVIRAHSAYVIHRGCVGDVADRVEECLLDADVDELV